MLHLREQLPVGFAELPDWIFKSTYDYARYPGVATLTEDDPRANCQLFAYTVLELLGLPPIPRHRSSELWTDEGALETVREPAVFDLVLYGKDKSPYGAHVGIWVDEYRILHLCAEEGSPAIWSSATFAMRERYAVRIGWKRVRVPNTED